MMTTNAASSRLACAGSCKWLAYLVSIDQSVQERVELDLRAEAPPEQTRFSGV